jgi:hypothetical protein
MGIVSCDISPQTLFSQVLGAASVGQEKIIVELIPSESGTYKLKKGIAITIPEDSVVASDILTAEVKSGEFSSDPTTNIRFFSENVLEISLENQDFFKSAVTLSFPISLDEFPEGTTENEVSAFYLRDFAWIPVPADVEPDQKTITIKSLHPGTWTWGLVENVESDGLYNSWLSSVMRSTESESVGEELYQQRLSKWEASWEQLTEQINTMLELEEKLEIGFDHNLLPVKGASQKELHSLMDRFGINKGPAVLFIVGAQEIGVVKAVLGSDYIVDYFGDPNQLNEIIKSERLAWMRLKEAECIRDSISYSGIHNTKPYCIGMINKYAEGLQSEGRIDDQIIDFDFSAITDEYFNELMPAHIQDMAAIEDIFNVEIVDQEISYDETGEKIEMPDLTGMTQENAEQLLNSLGFEVEILDGNSDYDPGIIFKQKPEAGIFSDPTITVVKIYRTIDE